MNKSTLAALLPTAWEEKNSDTDKILSVHAFSKDHIWLTKKKPAEGWRKFEAIWNGYDRIGWWAINDKDEYPCINFRRYATTGSLFDLPPFAVAKNTLMIATTPFQWLAPYPRYDLKEVSYSRIQAAMYEDNNHGGWIVTNVVWTRRDNLYDEPNLGDILKTFAGVKVGFSWRKRTWPPQDSRKVDARPRTITVSSGLKWPHPGLTALPRQSARIVTSARNPSSASLLSGH